jgi:hypothetical protein
VNDYQEEGQGEYGWSPVYRLGNGQWVWDDTWPSAYRHDNDDGISTPYGSGTQQDADRYSTSSSAPRAFYQYVKLDIGISGDYILDLDFYLREDSRSTISSVDNWEILILGTKESSWTGNYYYRHQEANCDEHGVFKRQQIQLFSSSDLNDDHQIWLLIGNWDSWSADWSQGHTKYFNDIKATEPDPNLIWVGPPWQGIETDYSYPGVTETMTNYQSGEHWVKGLNHFNAHWYAAEVSYYMEFVSERQDYIYMEFDARILGVLEQALGAAGLTCSVKCEVIRNGWELWVDRMDFEYPSIPPYAYARIDKTQHYYWVPGPSPLGTEVSPGDEIKISMSLSCTVSGFILYYGFGSCYGDSGSPYQGFAYMDVDNVLIRYYTYL